MAGQYTCPEGDLEQIFIDDFGMIDRFAGTGSLWTCGRNVFYGHLGDNTTADKSSPVQTISSGTNWKSASCNAFFTTALKTDGTLWSWGMNTKGQLGDNTTVDKSSPVQIISGGTNWKLISAGRYHTTAIKTDGTLWLWGENAYYGALGDNTIVNKSSPIQTIAGGNSWKSVAAGARSTVAIKTDGTLWTWGHNLYGQLGDNTIAHKSSPVQTIAGGTNWKSVAAGLQHTAAIKTDGTLWLWGRNNNAQINSTFADKSSPVQTVSGGTNWKLVSGGLYHTVAIKTDGTLWLWGYNNYGQLGDNTILTRTSPVQTIAGGTNWKLVLSGDNHVAGIKTDGTLWLWGHGGYGRLGNNATGRISSPIQTVAGGTNWKLVSCGANHTAAIHFYDANNLYPSA